MQSRNAGFTSAVIYTALSLLAAGIFLAATLAGEYSAIARFGGTLWVFLLAMIVLMPIVTPLVKKRLGS